jgi:hypothetical protein
MTLYLRHHRAFCENLNRLHDLEVSWDGKGGMPLMKKALLSAMELFGHRPDLVVGSRVELFQRGGLLVSLFRNGRDVSILFCGKGSVRVSCHRPKMRPDFTVSHAMVTSGMLTTLETPLPFNTADITLDVEQSNDVRLVSPFDGFNILRLRKSAIPGECRLYMGRTGFLPGLYAFQDAIDLPEDLPVDQPLTDTSCLSDLMKAYRKERLSLQACDAGPMPA